MSERIIDKADALVAADEIIDEFGAAHSYESFRRMLALAFTKGALAGVARAAGIYERKAA